MFYLIVEEEENNQHASESIIGIIIANNAKEAARKIGKKILETNAIGDKFVKHPRSGYLCWLTRIKEVTSSKQLEQLVKNRYY